MFESAFVSDVSGLHYWFCASRWQLPESKIAGFLVYTIIIYLLTIVVQNYYAKPIYHTHVSISCERLTDWSIRFIKEAECVEIQKQREYTVASLKNLFEISTMTANK